MAKEIERKFLVKDDLFLQGLNGVDYKQGYILGRARAAVRIRIVGDRGFITLKGATAGISRSEFEYEIPLSDANQILEQFCQKPFIKKTRYEVRHAGCTWEVDVFHGDNAGLIMAEIELEAEQQSVEIPPWAGHEVTDDSRYFNANLAVTPYGSWARA